MKLRHRQRLLAFARFLDRCALRIRAFVREQTPKRKRVTQEQAT